MVFKNNIGAISGILFTALFALIAIVVSNMQAVSSLGLSALVIAILFGMVFANTFRHTLPKAWDEGIQFSAKRILRIAIVLYGFRITFQQIASVGVEALALDLIIIASTFSIAMLIGVKLLKLDRESSALIGSGASICGAAAVLATEGTLKSEPHKSAMAVATVVLFGTIAMFAYPLLYNAGFLELSEKQFGVFVGATIHEVAQVVVAGAAISQTSAEYAVIVKMARVMALAPFLLIIGYLLARGSGSKAQIPWFAFGFVAVAGFNSLNILPLWIVDTINYIDLFLLAMAMAALGIETSFAKLKNAGLKAFALAFILFMWLFFGGLFLTKLLV